ncbi:MAG: hypothetical protein QOC94_3625 [Actinoplanes sp.]|jgi:hypothetical protein|nr:hypothetical protein [Pseudonocardiales bacterium]MDT5033454.1 hypothetical protein [Actinoplanes sp.]
MAVNPSSLTTDQLNTFIKARLVISGIDLGLFPTTPDPATGAPTQDQVLASMRSFILNNPVAINTWRPTAPSASAADKPRLSLMLDVPLEYPSITEAWTDHGAGR